MIVIQKNRRKPELAALRYSDALRKTEKAGEADENLSKG